MNDILKGAIVGGTSAAVVFLAVKKNPKHGFIVGAIAGAVAGLLK